MPSVTLRWCLLFALARTVAVDAQNSGAHDSKPVPKESAAASLEVLDLDMYSRIREEGLRRSHVMEYAAALLDDIGPRLTGSPAMALANEWTRAQLADMGCSNAHQESWGEFGMAWTQINASLSMIAPSTGVFLTQATPWSPATQGPVTADLIAVPSIQAEGDLSAWKGKLRGKVILYGQSAMSPEVNPDDVPQMKHTDATELASYAQYPVNEQHREMKDYRNIFQAFAFKEKVAKFFANEGAVAVIEPGGSGGVLYDDLNFSMGWYIYKPEHKQSIPQALIATEAWNRMSRLLDHKVPTQVQVSIATRLGDEHAKGYNTIADIPGTDPKRKDEVVMVGAHLDSWTAGTGATDNGAGVVVAMEAMRILNSLHVKPRRTIRIGLWSGEEQGLLGSTAYVTSHYATLHYSDAKEDAEVPLFLRTMSAPATLKPDAAKLDAYYNLDNGTGKVLGIDTQGNLGSAAIFSQWIQPLRDLAVTTVSNRSTDSTDHLPFRQAGLPGFQFIQDPRDYDSRTHHTNLDTYEHLSEPDLKQAAVIEAIFLYNTAMRDSMLPRPELPFVANHKELEGLYPSMATKPPR